MGSIDTQGEKVSMRHAPRLVRAIAAMLVVTLLGLASRAATNTGMWWGIDGLVLVSSLVMGSFAWFASKHGTDARDWRASLVSMGVVWVLLLLAWAAYVVLFDVMGMVAA
ncbi:MAG: hypothetical protein IT432_06840 [Phycisphaerales bacterium]|nr:hypothetical protein [Phycisphaerales bacterium]